MALVVQNDQGTVAGANAYIDVAELDAYHAARGNAYPGTPNPAAKEQAIIRATDYLDQRFKYVGKKLNGRDQTTQWPRMSAFDCSRDLVNGVPREVKEATAEYAMRALSATLNPDPSRDESGAMVQAKREQVGPMSQSVEFVSGAVFTMPRYPAADAKLKSACLVLSAGDVLRA